MKYTLTLLLFFAVLSRCSGQSFVNVSHGPRILAIGNAYTCVGGIETAFNNPASLFGTSSLEASVSLSNRYQIKELLDFHLGLAGKLGQYGNAGLQISQFGTGPYIDQRYSLQYAKYLFDKVALGLGFDLFHSRVDGYSSKNVLTPEIGLISQLNKKLTLGFHAFSPFGQRYSGEQALPSIMALGIKYNISSQVILFGEIEKNSFQAVQFKFGLEYQLYEALILKAGAYSNNQSLHISSGFSWTIQSIHFMHFAISYHPYLGLSSGIGMKFQLSKNAKTSA